MTTHDTIMALADSYASDAADSYWQNDQGWKQDVIAKAQEDMDKARAALSAALTELLAERDRADRRVFEMRVMLDEIGAERDALIKRAEDAEARCKHIEAETLKICVVKDELAAELARLKAQEPVAWGYRGKDGVIRDCIGPDSHADCEGDYTIPLYLASGAVKETK